MATRIFVAGHMGMVGSAIVRQLSKQLDVTLLLAPRSELDLTDGAAVQKYIQLHKPDQIYLAAAKVGGIHANNTYPAEFIADNLAIQEFLYLPSAYKTAYERRLFTHGHTRTYE
jgi:GDP-L-fucose synthase